MLSSSTATDPRFDRMAAAARRKPVACVCRPFDAPAAPRAAANSPMSRSRVELLSTARLYRLLCLPALVVWRLRADRCPAGSQGEERCGGHPVELHPHGRVAVGPGPEPVL